MVNQRVDGLHFFRARSHCCRNPIALKRKGKGAACCMAVHAGVHTATHTEKIEKGSWCRFSIDFPLGSTCPTLAVLLLAAARCFVFGAPPYLSLSPALTFYIAAFIQINKIPYDFNTFSYVFWCMCWPSDPSDGNPLFYSFLIFWWY